MRTLNCTGCGGEIIVDSSQEFGYCRYCGKKVMLKQHVKLEGIVDEMIESKLRSAETFWVRHHNRAEALKLFDEVAHEASSDYRGWWGLARVYSDNFSNTQCDPRLFQTIKDAAEKAMNVASGNVLPGLQKTWRQYTQPISAADSQTAGKIAGKRSAMEPLLQQRSNLQSGMQTVNQKRNTLQEQINIVGVKSAKATTGIVAGVILFFGGEFLNEVFFRAILGPIANLGVLISFAGMLLVPGCLLWKICLGAKQMANRKNLSGLNAQYQKLEADYRGVSSQIDALKSQIEALNATVRV